MNAIGLHGFILDSNPPNRGGLRKDSDSIRSNVNAIRLDLDWRWDCYYGEIAVCFVQNDEHSYNATCKSETSPVSVQIQSKFASVTAP